MRSWKNSESDHHHPIHFITLRATSDFSRYRNWGYFSPGLHLFMAMFWLSSSSAFELNACMHFTKDWEMSSLRYVIHVLCKSWRLFSNIPNSSLLIEVNILLEKYKIPECMAWCVLCNPPPFPAFQKSLHFFQSLPSPPKITWFPIAWFWLSNYK